MKRPHIARRVFLLGWLMTASLGGAAWSLQNPQQPADQPAPKLGPDGQIQARFRMKHESFLQRGREAPVGLLFLGDSITEGWGRAPDIWKERYEPHAAANFGIGGDRTQHVLWRIAEGELNGIKPKVVVLMIGTNNIAYPAEAIAAGNRQIVSEIRKRLPESRILLLGIFPRGADPSMPRVAMQREKIRAVNAELARLDDGKWVRYLDIGGKFLDAEGRIPADVMPDALHPNLKGYQIWAEAMQSLLNELLK